MSAQHTPGPWLAVDGSTTGRAVIAPEQPKVRRNVAAVGGQNREANARLIAAAPDLFNALAAALDEIDQEIEQRKFGGNDEYWASLQDISNAGRAAIAKARGEA